MSEADVAAALGFVARDAIDRFRAKGVPYRMDIRARADGKPIAPPEPVPMEPVERVIKDARAVAEPFTLDNGGFTLVHRASAVKDWTDNDEVVRVYYEECKAVARELTGATHMFTFDHVRRDAGLQVYGGGLGEPGILKSERDEDAYVSMMHLDYTDKSTFGEYLALHGIEEPKGASRVVMLNFWRPIYAPVERDPLAIGDARTLKYDDILEINMLGFLPKNYSWHNIGMNLAQIANAPEQAWYYYPRMSPDELLVMQTYDSRGIMGRVSAHGAFRLPNAGEGAPPRRSVELRVLCYIDAH